MSNGTELRQEYVVYKQGSANTQSSIKKSIVSKLFGFVKDYPLKYSKNVIVLKSDLINLGALPNWNHDKLSFLGIKCIRQNGL